MDNEEKKAVMNEKRYDTRELEWDTQYFNIKCARIDIQKKLNKDDINHIEEYIDKYKFITITNAIGNSFNNNYIGSRLKAFLADVNVSLTKNIELAEITSYKKNIHLENNKPYNEQLLNLVDGAFKNSRFLNDENISKEKAHGVYKEWVKNSFNREDRYFITYNFNGEVIAFVLFSKKNKQELIIELICVNDEYIGNGLGKKLMRELDSYALKNNFKIINVGTQIENINALNFYIKFGYKIKDIRYIYHFWNKEN